MIFVIGQAFDTVYDINLKNNEVIYDCVDFSSNKMFPLWKIQKFTSRTPGI